MKLAIVPKVDLSADQLRRLEERLQSPDHVNDKGPSTFWNRYSRGLYAVVDEDTGVAVGIIEASGPPGATVPGWWLDMRFRGQGHGNALIDALAAYLKHLGVTGIGPILIDTFARQYSGASAKLAHRLRRHFPTRSR